MTTIILVMMRNTVKGTKIVAVAVAANTDCTTDNDISTEHNITIQEPKSFFVNILRITSCPRLSWSYVVLDDDDRNNNNPRKL